MNLKSLLKQLTLTLLLLMIVSCGSNSSKKTTNATENVTEVVQVSDLDELLKNADNYADKQVTVEAFCSHVCEHAGCKLFLQGSDESISLRVNSPEDSSFSTDCLNSIVKITGHFVEQKLTEEDLLKWEAQLAEGSEGKSECENDKKARGEKEDSEEEIIKDYREKIAKRMSEEGKNYLSFYTIDATEYEILP